MTGWRGEPVRACGGTYALMTRISGGSARAIALAAASAAGCAALVAACTGSMTDTGGGGGDAGPRLEGDGGPPGDDGGPAGADGGPGALDAGGFDDGGGAMPDGGDDLVGVFVAQGHAGRTTVSCDDGRTWIANQSMDDSIRCFSDGFDCDHHPGSAKGVTYGRGWFFATYGWGPPGSIQRSRDGVSWEPVLEGTTFGGIAFGQDRVLAAARRPRWSADDGASWTEHPDAIITVWNVRRSAWVPHEDGRHVVVGEDSGDKSVALSSDGGDSWWHPTTIPAECGGAIQNEGGIAYGAGAILIVGGDGWACRSTDGGDTFTATRITDDVTSHLVWTGDRFMVWGRGVAWQSPDGASFSETPTTPADLHIGAVDVSAEGTFAAVRGGWNQWYESQRWYRSEDGVTWTELADGAYTGSHPIRDIHYARIPPNETCPAM